MEGTSTVTPVEPAEAGPDHRATVFLSYAHADRAKADKIAQALGKAGVEVWWDALIEAGAVFSKSIESALEVADSVCVLWSKTSVESHWVRDEAARGRDSNRLIPLSLDGSEPPLGFRQFHTIDLSRWRGRGNDPEFVAVLRCIDSLKGRTGSTRPINVPAMGTVQSSRRGVLLAAGCATAVACGAGALAWQRGWLSGSVASSNSVAVIPFANLGGDPAQGYFSDGLTEEIRTELARHDALKVLAATSSETAREHKEDAVTIARRLGVNYLLEGSVRRANQVVRIAAELIDGNTGFSHWSKTFDRSIADVFSVQSEIAQTVAEALSIRLATADPVPGGTTSVAAYEAFLRGRAMFNAARDEATDRAALAQYDLAIASDPNFAMAHAARSRSLAAIAAEYASAATLRPLYDEALAAARRAVALAPAMAEGHLALGYSLFTGRLDIKGAGPSYDKAYQLGRGSADIVVLFALYCSRAGRAREASAAILRALALDPLNPRTFRASGSISYAARHYAAAIAPLQRALQLNPGISNAHGLIGSALLQLGKLDEARAAFLAEPHSVFKLPGLAIVDHRLGDEKAAKVAMNALVTELGDSALYQQAEVRAQWGDIEGALAALERGRAIGDSGLIYLATDPMLDPLRNSRRFALLLAGIGAV